MRLSDAEWQIMNALWRCHPASARDIMEYLYLLETWYRDELVWQATGDPMHLMNRDQVACLEAGASTDAQKKVAAIERARQYLERFINEERVFRDLFFVLAE